MRNALLFLVLSFGCAISSEPSYEDRVQAVFSSLDETSLRELLAFYHLYKSTPQSEQALQIAWKLMNRHRPFPLKNRSHFLIPDISLDALIALSTTGSTQATPPLTLDELSIITQLGEFLGNRSLKGHDIWDYRELAALTPDEIDVARGILLHEFDPSDDEQRKQLLLYEGSLDLMALQILARLPLNPSNEEKIDAINAFIFHEMRYRFPPHSMWNKDVDLYTFLPAVMDSRQGVCLGVSILYFSLAQRLLLPLEMIVPPGHIYLSYAGGTERINIETTARGIDFPEETYLNINTKSLQKTNPKEVIGIHFFNLAGTAWQNEDFKKAKNFYKLSQTYLPYHSLRDTLLAFQYLFLGEQKKGDRLLKQAQLSPSPHTIYQNSITTDFLENKTDMQGIRVVYMQVDERRESIIEKQQAISDVLERYPEFREGIFHLAITWLQLGRTKEALDSLQRYHELDPYHPIVEYYLTILSINRLQYQKAWEHFLLLEKILFCHDHHPKMLDTLRDQLVHLYPYQISL